MTASSGSRRPRTVAATVAVLTLLVLLIGGFSPVMLGAGVIAAGITGIGAWFAGLPFLTSTYGYVKLPGLEKFELASAMGFDLGVFLCVVGAVMLALNSLSRIARRTAESTNRPGDAAPPAVPKEAH